jgi:hypothetical protein
MNVCDLFYMEALGQVLVLREKHSRIGIYFFEIYGGARDGEAVHLTTGALFALLATPEGKK